MRNLLIARLRTRRPDDAHARARHRRGLLRVAGYFSVVTIIATTISIRHARAEVEDQTLLFGRQMVELAKATNHEVTKINFNGQTLHVGSSVTPDTPEVVLARYEDYCDKNFGQIDDLKDANLAKFPDPPTIAKAGLMRAKAENDGAVVCFAKGPKTKSTSAAAFELFMTTGELGAFGDLRYAYASKNPSGKTLVLTVWTDSTFNLKQMIPSAEGQDAPGEDFAEVPRVPSSQRIMSAKAEGMPYGVNVYRTSDAPGKTLAFFDREMKQRGWFTYDPELTAGGPDQGQPPSEEHELGRAYMKNAVVLTVATTKQPDGNFVALGLAGVPEERASLPSPTRHRGE